MTDSVLDPPAIGRAAAAAEKMGQPDDDNGYRSRRHKIEREMAFKWGPFQRARGEWKSLWVADLKDDRRHCISLCVCLANDAISLSSVSPTPEQTNICNPSDMNANWQTISHAYWFI